MRVQVALGSVLAVGLIGAVHGTSSAQPSDQVAVSQKTAGPPNVQVELTHPIDAANAQKIVASVDEAIGFRFSQPGLVGEVYGGNRLDLQTASRTIAQDHNVDLAVESILITSTSNFSSAATSEIVRHAALMPEVAKTPAGGPSELEANKLRRAALAAPASKQGVDTAPWAPDHSALSAGTVNGLAKIIMWSQWVESSSGRDSALLPDDWGLEVEVSLFNSKNSGPTRPFCLPSNAPDRYWFGTPTPTDLGREPAIVGWTLSTIGIPAVSLDPEYWGAYRDSASYSDNCTRQSLSIGIAHPAAAFGSTGEPIGGFKTTIYGEPGTENSSPYSAGYQAVTNNCFGAQPNTDCMGLNPAADLPNGWGKSDLIVNLDRGWFMPGCVSYAYGYEPMEINPQWCEL